jgi:hypothetical protein
MLRSVPRMFRNENFVFASTGPGLVSRTLAAYPGGDQVMVLFPEDVWDAKSWYRFGEYGVHPQVGTWRTGKGLVNRVLHRNWERLKRKALLREGLKHGRKWSLCDRHTVNPCAVVERTPGGGPGAGLRSGLSGPGFRTRSLQRRRSLRHLVLLGSPSGRHYTATRAMTLKGN